MGARTGLDKDQIQLSLEELQEIGWIIEYKGYIMFLKNHVSPKKGRFTEEAMTREIEEIPSEIINYFQEKLDVSNLNSSGTLPEHKDNNNYNYINKDEEIEKKIEIVFDHLKTIFKQPKARLSTYRYAIKDAMTRDGFKGADIITAAKRVAASPYHQGDNQQKTVYANIAFLLGFTRAENRRRLAKWIDMPDTQKKKDYGF